jgi:hypothetical protein
LVHPQPYNSTKGEAMNLTVPTPQLIRQEIEEVKDPETNMYLKCLLTFGARSVEFANKNCNGEKAYGTTGKGYTWLSEYKPKSLSDDELSERSNQIINNPTLSTGQILMMITAKPAPVKIAVFKIPIAKKHLLATEPIIHRHTAIPFDKKYEPWTEEIYNYYLQHGKEPLFPNNRKHYLDYLRTRKVFVKFAYPVERYTIRTVLGKLETLPESNDPKRTFKKIEKTGLTNQYDAKPKHLHNFKLHGLRHIRTKELNDFYEIKETLALCSFIGWAPTRGPEMMIARYGNLYENYSSYLGNLLKQRTPQ